MTSIIPLLKSYAPQARTIIDGGAYVGAFTAEMRAAFPDAEIYAFEPCTKSRKILYERFKDDSGVCIYPLALSDEEGRERPLFLNAADYTDSLLENDPVVHQYVDAELIDRVGIEKVITTRLDKFCAIRGIQEIDILKLDLQGWDLFALYGASGILPKTKLIVCELLYVPIYTHQCWASDIEQHLAQWGFSEIGKGDGVPGKWGDVVFWNEGYNEKENNHE